MSRINPEFPIYARNVQILDKTSYIQQFKFTCLRKQLQDVPVHGPYQKMSLTDFENLYHKLDYPMNIFSDSCCLYQGKLQRGLVITYKTKKVTLNRLLVHNFLSSMDGQSRLSRACKNPLCVTLSHQLIHQHGKKKESTEITKEHIRLVFQMLNQKYKQKDIAKELELSSSMQKPLIPLPC